jgi:hypothetical protein
MSSIGTVVTSLITVFVGAVVGGVVGSVLERYRSSLWKGQERWKFKREVYERLLTSLADCGLANNTLSCGKSNVDEDEWLKMTERESKAIEEITRLTSVGAIFLSNDARSALEEFYKLGQVAMMNPSGKESRDKLAAVLKHTQERLIKAGRHDLYSKSS